MSVHYDNKKAHLPYKRRSPLSTTYSPNRHPQASTYHSTLDNSS